MEQIEISEEQKEIQLAESDLARVRAMVVETIENYRDCCQIEIQLKQSIKDTWAKFEDVVSKAHQAHLAATKLRSDAVNPRQVALKIVQDLRLEYEQRAEAARKQQEAEAQKQAAQKALDEAEELATVLDKSGEKELAAQVRADVPIPVVSIPKDIPKVKGIGTRVVWSFRVVKPAKLPRAYLMPNEAAIQAVVNSQGKAAERMIPGIQVKREEVARGAAKPKG